MKRYANNERRAMMRGRNSAANDFESSNVQQSEWENALTDVASQTLETYGTMNNLDQEMIAVLRNILQSQANHQAPAANASTVLDTILDAQKGLKSTPKAQSDNMRAPIGSLN